ALGGVGIGNSVDGFDAGGAGQSIFHAAAALLFLLGFGEVNRLGRGLLGNAPEVLLDLSQGFFGIEVPRKREDGVVGGVVGFVELLDILDGSGIQVGHRTEDRMLVGEVVVHQVVYFFGSRAEGL